MVYCKVLGSIRVFDAEGVELALVSESQRRLLAMLCLRSWTVVRSVVLEEHLGLSAGALRTSVSRLRRVIGAKCLVTGPAGYELRADVDVEEYEQLVNAAEEATTDQARCDLERARAIWDGSPYDEFADETWAEVEVRRLGELHTAAMEELVVILLNSGEEVAAMVELVSLMDEHPYRDRPRALLMRALNQTGRATEALRQYQAYRTVLRNDIGTEPSAALIELDRAIATAADLDTLRLQGHPAWTRHRGPPQVAERESHLRLPTPLSSFIGRGSETAEIKALLCDHRIVTLTGAGGSGKSRLALRVASIAPDRGRSDAWWIDLGVLAADGDVAEQIASEIGVVPRLDVVAELERRLQERPTLIVLDNAEHVIDATAEVLSALLTKCPYLRTLVTSREPLGISGEVVWRVPGLGLPEDATCVTLDNLDQHDALRLFLTRAREARPGMAVDRQAIDHIASICRELDGMPLALELAAARLRTLPLDSVARSVSEITHWTGSRRGAPLSRHATLRASIEWSFDLVSPIEQQMLVALTVFRSPFDADAACAVAAAIDEQGGAVDLIQRLTDVGLLHLDDDSGRYRMLHTVRQFCLEHGDVDPMSRHRVDAAHARFFASWCAAVAAGEQGIEHRPIVRRMPDVVAATAWARVNDHDIALRMCSDLAPVRSALGHSADFDATWRWLLSFDDERRDPVWAEAVAGLLTTATSRCFDTAPVVEQLSARLPAGPGRARSWLERSAALALAFGGRPAQIQSYAAGLIDRGDDVEASIYVGLAAYMLALIGRLEECDPLLEQLRRLTRRHDTTFSVDSVGNGYAAAIVAETIRGDLRLAVDRSRRPVPVDPAFSMTSAAALAHAALLSSDAETMERALEWATLGSFQLLRFLGPFTSCCHALLDGAAGDAADHAGEFWDEAAAVPVWQLFALPLVNSALIGDGRVDAAGAVTDRAAVLLPDMAQSPLLTTALHLAQAQVALACGCLDIADREAIAALDNALSHGFPLAVVDALELRAAVAERSGDIVRSRSVAEGARAERDRLGYRFVSAHAHRWPGSPLASVTAS
ncbi:MAG: BTAD domain-containing putative transcriptional regulator [Ilumatobacteraceae bacterium]